jgi:hypothetical protein
MGDGQRGGALRNHRRRLDHFERNPRSRVDSTSFADWFNERQQRDQLRCQSARR